MEKEKILSMNHLNPSTDGSGRFHFLICGTTYPNRAYCINRPSATLSTLEYVVRGSGHITIDGTSFSVHAGDTYFLPEGHDHAYRSDKDDPWEKIWVNFSGDFSMSFAKLCLVDGVFHYPKLNTGDLLQKMQYYTEHGDPALAFEQCSALVSQLFFRLSEHLRSPAEQTPSPVRRMLAYIERHITEPITVDRIAAEAGRSPSQAERLFCAEMGVPLYQYALDRKLTIACTLLNETSMTVKEIALSLSFADEFYFSGLFRRKIGISPSRYRSLAKNPDNSQN